MDEDNYKNKNIKIYNLIYVGMFIVFLCIPILFFNRDDEATSVLENKKLAEKPSLLDSENNINKEFISSYESYINDNIGLKQQAIELNISLMYKIFNILDLRDYMLGEDGNIFFINGGYGIKDYQGFVSLNKDQKELLKIAMNNVSKYLENRNIEFLFVGIPDKETIYPDKYPKTIHKMTDETQLDGYFEYIDNNCEFDYLYLKDKLLEEKENSDDYLYYKSYDCTHWNAKGMYVGYKAIMHKLLEMDNNLEFLDENRIEWNSTMTKSMSYFNHSKIMQNTVRLDDYIYDYKILPEEQGKLTDTLPDGFTLTDGSIYYHYVNDKINNDKTLVVHGDSYIYLYMLRLFAESFKDVYYIQATTATNVKKLIELTHADYVIFESVERAFYYWPYLGFLEEFVN